MEDGNEATQTGATPPAWVWQGLGWTAVALLLAAVLAIGLISAGVFDPRPVGEAQTQVALEAVTVPAGAIQTRWLPDPVLPDAYTLRLTATRSEGESDAGYGLLIGAEADHLAVTVSPLGYLAIWQQTGDEHEMLLPWQTWPHVRTGTTPNEIQVDVQNGQVTVRVNRELLWQAEWAPPGRDVGLIAQSFGGATTIDFRELILFTEDNQQ